MFAEPGFPLLAYFGMPGWAELLIVLAIALLLFGKRVPTAARSLGRSIVEFKKGVRGVEDDAESDHQTVEAEARKADRV